MYDHFETLMLLSSSLETYCWLLHSRGWRMSFQTGNRLWIEYSSPQIWPDIAASSILPGQLHLQSLFRHQSEIHSRTDSWALLQQSLILVRGVLQSPCLQSSKKLNAALLNPSGICYSKSKHKQCILHISGLEYHPEWILTINCLGHFQEADCFLQESLKS